MIYLCIFLSVSILLSGCKADLRKHDVQYEQAIKETARQEQVGVIADKIDKPSELQQITDLDNADSANIIAEFDALKEEDYADAEFDSLAENNDYKAEFDTMAEQSHYEAEFDSLDEKDYQEAEFDKISQDNVKAEFDSIDRTQAEPELMSESE
ncbi:MAG: hypothetical protein PHV77_02230 [Candidatus Omnitrophica bacterium]|nr:hypothetical protein [Candidatus Omnitrophota bacterium]